MDQGTNPTTILHVLIPVPVRLNLISLFDEYDNRIVLCNVAPLYRNRFESPLDPLQYGCLNMNQVFTSMKHLFYFHQLEDTVYVNCCLKKGSIKLLLEKEKGKTSLDMSFLENISFLFEPNDFKCIRLIFTRSLALNKPISVSQFEQNFISLASYAFNYLKYGFKSLSDLFITFDGLFAVLDSSDQKSGEENPVERSFEVKSSLGDTLVMLKLPTMQS